MSADDQDKAASPADQTDAAAATAEQPAPAWEAELDAYPLRDASEDPRWAVATVWIWVGVALFSTAFILVLIVLGYFYD